MFEQTLLEGNAAPAVASSNDTVRGTGSDKKRKNDLKVSE